MRNTADLVVSVGGGKGGVGKSLVATNLAVAIAQRGRRVALVDGDLGSPNLHTLLGVDRLPRTIDALLDREIGSLNEAQLPTGVPGLTLVAGSPAHPGAANLSHSQKQKLLRHVHALDAEIVIVDIGAGTSFNTIDLFNAADLRLLVTSPDLTAIQNAYAFLKGAVHRALRQLTQTPEQQELVESEGQAQETARLTGLLKRVRAKAPVLADAIELQLTATGAFLVANQCSESAHHNVPHALARMVHDFLSVDVPVLGCIASSRRIHDSVNRRRPWMLDGASEASAAVLREAAARLLDMNVQALRLARREAEALAESASGRADEKERTGLSHELSRLSRRAVRCRVLLPVTLRSENESATGHVVEISRCGARVSAARPLRSGERWTLRFANLDGAPEVDVIVRNLRPKNGTAGVEFVSSAPLPSSLERAVSKAERASTTPPGGAVEREAPSSSSTSASSANSSSPSSAGAEFSRRPAAGGTSASESAGVLADAGRPTGPSAAELGAQQQSSAQTLGELPPHAPTGGWRS